MRQLIFAVVSAALLAGIVVAGSGGARASGPIVGYPNSIASLGDSITQAMDADGSFGDQPENSWSTGASTTVNSIYSRLLAANPGISGHRYNDSVSGATMSDLNGQAQNAVSQGAALVLILIGANDVCTSSEATMTPVSTLKFQLETAMQTLSSGLPDSRIVVVSIPDIYNLWSILHNNSTARLVWAFAGICQSMLANPTSTAAADVQRRANVRQRNIDDNVALHDVCATYVHCRFDDYLAFNTAFVTSDVSTLDYFHPSVAGQAKIASLGWDNFVDFTDVAPPVSDSSLAVVAANRTLTLTATDNAGVSGIEYKIGAGAYQTYSAPFNVSVGSTITWRAVDVNGNVEATHSCKVGLWPWPANDSDCDGFTDASETFMGTLPQQRCSPTTTPDHAPDEWPADYNNDQAANLTDIFLMVPHLNTLDTDPGSSPRYDISGEGAINLTDIFLLVPFLNMSCA